MKKILFFALTFGYSIYASTGTHNPGYDAFVHDLLNSALDEQSRLSDSSKRLSQNHKKMEDEKKNEKKNDTKNDFVHGLLNSVLDEQARLSSSSKPSQDYKKIEDEKKNEKKDNTKNASTDAMYLATQIRSFDDYINVLGQYWRRGGHRGKLLPVSGEKTSTRASRIVRALIERATSLYKGTEITKRGSFDYLNKRISTTPSDILNQDFTKVAVVMLVKLLRTQMDKLPKQSQTEANNTLRFFERFIKSHYKNDPFKRHILNRKRKKKKNKVDGKVETNTTSEIIQNNGQSQINNANSSENNKPVIKPYVLPQSKKIQANSIKLYDIVVSQFNPYKGMSDKITKNVTIYKGDSIKRKYVVAAVKSGDVAKLDWMANNCEFDKRTDNFNETGSIFDCAEMEYPHNHLVHIALEENNMDMLDYLISNGADINIKNDEGDTILNIAVSNDNLEAVRFLLERGANPNILNILKENALHFAVAIRDHRIVDELINKGAKINVKEENGFTPMQMAYFYGNKDIVQSFLKHNANKEELNPKKLTHKQQYMAIRIATTSDNVEIVDSLIKAGFDVNKVNNPIIINGDIKNNAKLVNALIEEYKQNEQNVIFYAIENEAVEIVKRLIKAKVDVNVKDKYKGLTPLHIATEKGDLQLVQLLIKNKADVNAKSDDGATPLHLAAYDDSNVEIVRALIQARANVNAKGESDCTPLHYAAWKNSQKIAQLLIKAGANKRAQQYKGLTPLDRVQTDQEFWRRILQ